MGNILKSLIPNLILGIGFIIEMIAKGFHSAGIVVTHLGIQLHIKFNTKMGLQLKKVEEAVQEAVKNMMTLAKQHEAQQPVRKDESAKLADIVKGNNRPPVKLVSLRKKENNESKG